LSSSLDQLAPLYELPSPVVTWYLATPAPAEDSPARLDIAWKNAMRELTELGVADETREALLAARSTDEGRNGTRVLVAAGGKVHLDRSLPAPALASGLSIGPMPRLFPLIAWLGARRSHVVVLADRAGGEVIAYPATGEQPKEEVSAQTAEWPLHKTGTGGWAAKRFEATVEESWERSAERVATLVDDVVRRADPAVVVAAGDERAITLLREHLPVAVHERFVGIPGGGRHADGSDGEVSRRVAEAVAQSAAYDEAELLGRFAQALGRGEGAADGVHATVRALQQAQVETLLVTRGLAASGRELYFGPEATHLAADAAELDSMGVAAARPAPLVDAVLRAAIASGSDVVAISDDADSVPHEGLGAVLRFDTNPARPSAG
jgi:hypothetical protein